jgi:hypothetical protein
MAWPPPTLPTNRTNADAQQDTHPADHNAANLAINDTAGKLKASVHQHWRGIPGAPSLPPGGTLGYLQPVAVPAATWRRRLVVHFRGRALTMTDATWADIVLMVNNVDTARSHFSGPGAHMSTWPIDLAAGATCNISANVTGNGNSTWSNDIKYAALDVYAEPFD